MAGLDVERAALVARGFTTFFQLTNLAEQRVRVRALRERDADSDPVEDSVAAAVHVQGPAVAAAVLARGEGDEALLDRMAAASESCWRDLVGAQGFADFFRAVTPIEEIGALQMGSRPIGSSPSSR